MRNDIETRVIDDADLDAVSGGVISVNGGLAGAVTGDVTNLLGTVGSLQTVHAVEGIAGGVPGLAQGLTGVSVNAGVVTGLAGL
ncbi:hypothetical protein ACIGO8_05735 [Streptomyces sp. NPDC053493]|uniref:hypothetical protein n=1 Tax=Streptomyces sp. NPDC053493 TaxID=3365705 RepID=UPI0037CDF021